MRIALVTLLVAAAVPALAQNEIPLPGQSAQGDVAVTSDLQDGGLSVIDTATAKVVRSIAVSGPAEAEQRVQVTILWSADGNRIYVAETQSDTVAEVDYLSGKVLRRFKVGEGGDGMAILP